MEANFMAQRYQVSLRTATWARDSHGLFDYESQSVQVKHLCTHLERMLIRNQSGDVHLINKKELGQLSYNGTEPLFKIVPDPSRSAETFRIDNCSSTGTYEESNDKMWLVLRSMKKNEIKEEYQLRRGDILKLGRMRLKVKDFRIQDAPDPCDRSSCLIEEGPIDISTNDDKPVDENDACRICFGDDSTIENPLFAPCKCTGTMKFIHYGCLKQWLNLKLVPRPSANLDTYFWKSFECEICKTIYPFCIKHNDEKKYLVDVNLPDKGNYLLLESLIHERNTSRIIHVIKPNAEHKEFKLGRGHDSDVRVSDISVSRIHASLICKENGFFIMDHNSKFGTLSLIPELIMEPSLSRAVQVGRTVISIQVVPLRLEPTLISTLISLDSVILQQIVSDSLRKSAAQEFELPELMQREEKKEEESKNEEIEEEPLSAKPKN